MYLMFVDESGDVGLVNSPTRYFVLTGLVLHELRWRNHIDQLLGFRRELRVRYGLKLREEIHAGAMLGRAGALKAMPKHHRLEILRRFSDQLASMTEMNLISIVVDKFGKPPDYDVFTKAWTTLIQRFENTISYSNFPGPKNADERGMILCDKTDEKKLTGLLRKMGAYNPVANQSQFGSGYRNLALKYVIEDPVFRDSAKSLFIQAADLCAYLLYQHINPSAYVRKKSAQNYFDRLQPIMCRVASSTDPRGIVKL